MGKIILGKYPFRILLFSTALVLLVLGMGGCQRKAKGALQNKESEVQILEEQIQFLRSELESVQKELESERETSLELANLIQAYRAQSEKAHEDANTPNQPSLSASAPDGFVRELALLRSENSRLSAELQSLKALLYQKSLIVSEGTQQPAAGEVFEAGSSGRQKIKDDYAAFVRERQAAARLKILDSMGESAINEEPEMVGLLEKAMEDPEPEVVRMAAEMLESYRTPIVLGLIEKALRSRDEEVRLSVLGPLEEIEDPKCAELAVLALSDPSDAVRSRALDVIRGQSPDIQILSLSRAFQSASDDVKSEVLSLLELRADKAAVEVLFGGLKDSNPEFREEVKEILHLLLDQEFSSYNQAMRWWKANRDRFDENLFEE